jgi:hypothetical protein
MSDYIKREDAVEALDECFDDIPIEQTTEILKLRRKLRMMPSTDVVERKCGKWIDDIAYYDEEGCPCITSICNKCGKENPQTNFCPNCGADMRQGE